MWLGRNHSAPLIVQRFPRTFDKEGRCALQSANPTLDEQPNFYLH